MNRSWKKYLFYASLIIIGGGLIFILVETVRAKNTGFETKTLWDWMELLIIPLFLAGGAFFLNRSERSAEREIATDRQQEAALQAYIDRMSDLLLKDNLRTTKSEEVRNVARIRTLSVLRGLDPTRKGIVVLFLSEAGLIFSHYRYSQDETVVDLKGADLIGIELSGASLNDANLSNANLSMANFQGTIFDGCDFTCSNLTFANLQGCDLAGYNGPGLPSKIFNADLSFANLANALVVGELLTEVKSLKGATMPDGTIHK